MPKAQSLYVSFTDGTSLYISPDDLIEMSIDDVKMNVKQKFHTMWTEQNCSHFKLCVVFNPFYETLIKRQIKSVSVTNSMFNVEQEYTVGSTRNFYVSSDNMSLTVIHREI